MRNKIKQSASTSVAGVAARFSSTSTAAQEDEFRRRTTGLVTAEEFREASRVSQEALKANKEEAARVAAEEALVRKSMKKKERSLKRKKMGNVLSFGIDEEDQDGENQKEEKATGDQGSNEKKRMMKNPNVNTSYLPDRERDKRLELERQRLKEDWTTEQERIKQEQLEIVYSYWDGSGHRREVRVQKGTTIGGFLELTRIELSHSFSELRSLTADSLMYIKEDLIIPHHYSFYDLIVTRARGKSGPLFNFDVHDDVRLLNDATVEKDESHPGKIVERRWYERNKHIFPASRWEIYDPKVERGAYTIHGD